MIYNNNAHLHAGNSVGKREDGFNYLVDQFDDIRVLRYRLPGFELLPLKLKKYIFFLSRAALSGRDILWDQNFRHNLRIRKTLEAIINSYYGDRNSEEYNEFLVYAKRVFFANGIHHHYSSDKMMPGFTRDYFESLIRGSESELLPLEKSEDCEKLILDLTPILFKNDLFAKKVELKDGIDLVAASASNFYEGVTQEEVEKFYSGLIVADDPQPVSLGLNSRVILKNGKVNEEVYRSGGKYGEAIDHIILWLEKAASVAETLKQKEDLGLLVEFYKSGDLKTWDDYNVSWAKNTEGIIDYINGFIENYEDPLGMKATWESVVEYTDIEATRKAEIITVNAQWFEDHSPIDPKYRKEKVTGVAARVINVAMLGGDCYPASPLGINLPNADWIRKEVGSKSVRLANISDAYDTTARNNGFLDEFAADEAEVQRIEKYGSQADELHTDLHECVGHASGKLADGTDPNALKNYASALEESRADLFALYFMTDEKITELGLLPHADAGKASYDAYIRNGLISQLVRIKPGKTIEEAHMRCRSLISQWAYEKGKEENVIELFRRNEKTFVRINNYSKLRILFGSLLKEIQRIKSEGDFESGKNLIEKYGVAVEPRLHSEILERYASLNLAPYTGFVNPELVPEYDNNGEMTDVRVEYPKDYLSQMMNYGRDYSFLSTSGN
jgi:dipeptidyl-peptidase III